MMGRTPAAGRASARTAILELTHLDARGLLLKPESYCSLDLPPYIDFGPLLDGVQQAIGRHKLATLRRGNPRHFDGVNHRLLSNKDGKYSWRPFELIHPALYVSLVRELTNPSHWSALRRRFEQFAGNPRVRCLSIPVRSESEEKDRAAQITQWWEEVEQRSIELSLSYEYLAEADIAECYSSIYTHSIAWALHGKPEAKKKRGDPSLLGNIIDHHIQDMRHGQTNGIPQGSVLMDFVAEMVLGYADMELTERINDADLQDYQILRYRDDYRIFANDQQTCAMIIKLISETCATLGLKLSTAKTRIQDDVVGCSIKRDKLAWMSGRQWAKQWQQQLLIIHGHASHFPNAGSVVKALGKYQRRLQRAKHPPPDVLPLIAIVSDIAFRNPKASAICAAILSRLLQWVRPAANRRRILKDINRRFGLIPNTGLMDVWLQRITYPLEPSIKYVEPLCRVVAGEPAQLWDSTWISSRELRNALNARRIVDTKKLSKVPPVIRWEEVQLFAGSGVY